MRMSRAEANRAEIPPQLQLTTATFENSGEKLRLPLILRGPPLAGQTREPAYGTTNQIRKFNLRPQHGCSSRHSA